MEDLVKHNYTTLLVPMVGLLLSGVLLAFKFKIHKKITINDEKGILLPSFCILISPFLSSILFNISQIPAMNDINILSSVITIVTTTISIYTANSLLDCFREQKKIQENAKLFLYKLRENKNYLIQIKDDIKNPKNLKNCIYLGLSANESVSLLLDNKEPDYLSIFDESLIEQIAQYFSTVRRFTFEFQRFSEDKEEIPRNIMAVRADQAIIEVDLCILVFLVKYFSKSQQAKIQELKTYFQWKYKELKDQESEILDQPPKYYYVYSIPNIEKVFKSLNWDIKR